MITTLSCPRRLFRSATTYLSSLPLVQSREKYLAKVFGAEHHTADVQLFDYSSETFFHNAYRDHEAKNLYSKFVEYCCLIDIQAFKAKVIQHNRKSSLF